MCIRDRPEGADLKITDGRHPVVEALSKERFVPNDAVLGGDTQTMVITGPNMAGKSTYMRQTALIVLMAHIGCFVPARAAEIPIVDRIFTRVGASDNLILDQSTFCLLYTSSSIPMLIRRELKHSAQVLNMFSINSYVLSSSCLLYTSLAIGICLSALCS